MRDREHGIGCSKGFAATKNFCPKPSLSKAAAHVDEACLAEGPLHAERSARHSVYRSFQSILSIHCVQKKTGVSFPFLYFVRCGEGRSEIMDTQTIDVLLIRNGQSGHSPLSNRLERRGCQCRFATSSQDIGTLLAGHHFDLVLGPVRLDGDSLYPLMSQLQSSRTTLFYYLIVEHGCWWLPAVWLGADCFGAPAIHNREFVTVLDETLEAIRFRASAAAESGEAKRHRGSDSRMTFPFPRKTGLPGSPPTAKILQMAARRAAR
jgi:hypothetical protein